MKILKFVAGNLVILILFFNIYKFSVIKCSINFILEIGVEIIPLLSPSLKNASEDNKWRVRLETLEGVVKIAQHFRVYIYLFLAFI